MDDKIVSNAVNIVRLFHQQTWDQEDITSTLYVLSRVVEHAYLPLLERHVSPEIIGWQLAVFMGLYRKYRKPFLMTEVERVYRAALPFENQGNVQKGGRHLVSC